MTRSLDERGRLIDRVGELHLLPAHVVEEAAAAIADQVADHQGDLDGVATEPRLVAADDDVSRLRVGDQSPDPQPVVEVIARLAVIHVLDHRQVTKRQPLDELLAPGALDIEAELLLALVVLRPAQVDVHVHRLPLPSSSEPTAAE